MSASAFEKIRGRLADLASESKSAVYEIRDRIEDLKTQLRRVGNAPDDLASIGGRIDTAISQAASQAGFFRPTGLEKGGPISISRVCSTVSLRRARSSPSPSSHPTSCAIC